MMSISKNQYRIVEYIIWIIEKEPFPSYFNDYQNELIRLYEQSPKEKWIINKIYEKANDLIVGNIDIKNFRNEIDIIYNNAEKIFN